MIPPTTQAPGISAPLVLLAALLAVLTAHAAAAVDAYQPAPFVHATLAHGFFYAAAVAWVLWRPSSARDLAAILLIALLLRLIAASAAPGLTTDLYRYVWDGRLMLAGTSPYLHVPADPALAAFRDADVFPHINQKETAHTIYPPVAQLVFALGSALDPWIGTPRDGGHTAMRAVMMGFEALTVAALVKWLDFERLPRERVVIYAWHPVTVWEFGGQGHIDAAATALMVMGLLAAVSARRATAGALIAAAGLVKYFAFVLLPGVWLRGDWRLPAAIAATAALLYLPHLVTAGGKVAGFLVGHLDNEGYRTGWGFHPVWLMRELGSEGLSGTAYVLLAGAALLTLAAWVHVKRQEAPVDARHLVLLSAAFIWLTSAHYPWYFGWVVPLLVLAPHPAVLLMTLTSMTLHLPRPPGGITWTGIYLATYWLPFLTFIAWEIARTRWRRT